MTTNLLPHRVLVAMLCLVMAAPPNAFATINPPIDPPQDDSPCEEDGVDEEPPADLLCPAIHCSIFPEDSPCACPESDGGCSSCGGSGGGGDVGAELRSVIFPGGLGGGGLGTACDVPTPPRLPPEEQPKPEEDPEPEPLVCEVTYATTDQSVGSRTAITGNPIVLASGLVVEGATDLYLKGPGASWAIGRSYRSDLTGSSMMGNRWASTATEIELVEGSGGDIELIYNANSRYVFESNGSGYDSPAGTQMTLEADTANDQFILTNERTGAIAYFHDFTVTEGTTAARGKIKELNTIDREEEGLTGITYNLYTQVSGVRYPSSITSAAPQSYAINLSYSPTSGLTSVVVKDSTATTELKKVEYTYKDGTHSSDLGSAADLVQVKRSWIDSGGAWTSRYTQYRYDTDSRLKGVLKHADIMRLVDAGSLSGADAVLALADEPTTGPKPKDYASKWFTYYGSTTDPEATTSSSTVWDSGASENLEATYSDTTGGSTGRKESGFVRTERVGSSGCSSCGGGHAVEHEYFYLELDQGAADDVNEVKYIVVEDTSIPGTTPTPVSRHVYGLNSEGRKLRSAVTNDPTPGSGSALYWCHSWKFGDSGGAENKIVESRRPSAHKTGASLDLADFFDPYDDSGAGDWGNDTDTLQSGQGVVHAYQYTTDGRLQAKCVKKGADDSTPLYLMYREYGDGTTVPARLQTAVYSYPGKIEATTTGGVWTNYKDIGDAGKWVKHSLSYTFWDASKEQIQSVTTTYPMVGTAQNGSGATATAAKYYDRVGRLRWTQDAEGYITYYSYDTKTGRHAYTAVDVDPASVTGGTSGLTYAADSSLVQPNDDGDGTAGYASAGLPTYDSSLPTPLKLESKGEFDDLGRISVWIGQAGDKTVYVYETDRTITFPYVDGSGNPGLPILVREWDDRGSTTEVYAVKANYASISKSGSTPTGFSTSPKPKDFVSWTVYRYDDDGELLAVDRYHDIPNSSITNYGSLSTNFHRSATLRDDRGRTAASVQTVSGSVGNATVQISLQTYDDLGRSSTSQRWVESGFNVKTDGTSGDLDHGDIATTGASKPVMSVSYYDGADSTTPMAVGDGHLTSSLMYHTESGGAGDDYTLTTYYRDFRGRLHGAERKFNGTTSVGPYQVTDLDWAGRATAVASYKSVPSFATAIAGDGDATYAESTTTNRIGLALTRYNDLGQVYQSDRCNVSNSNGSVHGIHRTNSYYDRNGRLVATEDPYGVSMEYAYDGAGRQYQSRTVLQLYGPDEGSDVYYNATTGDFTYRAPLPDPDLSSMSGGDKDVIQLSHTVYDSKGRAIEQHSFEANHDDTDGLDLDGSDCVRSTSHSWYDDQDRLTTMADYGSGNGSSTDDKWEFNSAPSYGSEPSTPTDYMLLTVYDYDDESGRQDSVKTWQDASTPIVTRTFYDDLGRRTYVAENWTNFAPPSTGIGSGDEDRVTGWEYNGLGQVTTLTAHNGASEAQDTKYLYEDAYNASLVTNTIYPDSSDTASSGTDQVKVAYNLDGSVATRTDQRGVVMTYSYDNARRVTLEAATADSGTLASKGVDDTIQAIGRAYDSHGRVSSITSYDTATSPGSGDEVNQIVYTYKDYGPLNYAYLDHDGAKDGTTPKNEYRYDEDRVSGAGTLYTDGLRQELTYPAILGSGAKTYTYFGSPTDLEKHDRLNLPKFHKLFGGTLRSGESHTLRYNWNGLGRLAKAWSVETGNVTLQYSSSSGVYDGWDRFGRVKQQKWTKGGTSIDHFNYDYDYAGNRTARYNTLATSGDDVWDEVYTYDELHRLANAKRGTDSTDNGSIDTEKFEQNWTLDQLGNWSGLAQETNGTSDFSQTRTHDKANQLGTISNWANPAHDAAGNMTTIPVPESLGNTYTAEYDAWNRLISLSDGGPPFTYEYDGLHRRIQKVASSTTTNYYYNEQWQCILESTGTGASEAADTLYLWHPHYVDALAVRMRASDEHFFTHDANFNVTAAVEDTTGGPVVERYAYTPYGECTVLNGASDGDGAEWTVDSAGDIDNEHLYTGRRTDPETGLQLNRRRYYHQQLGRWVSRDSLKYEADSMNLYSYVEGNPLNKVDSMGFRSERPKPPCEDTCRKASTIRCTLINDFSCKGVVCPKGYRCVVVPPRGFPPAAPNNLFVHCVKCSGGCDKTGGDCKIGLIQHPPNGRSTITCGCTGEKKRIGPFAASQPSSSRSVGLTSIGQPRPPIDPPGPPKGRLCFPNQPR